mmetsp:Transcript_11798/g.22087  ORF Transcript_11798/g.22087 Transcript_11798/m.22087 type:complete len:347 (+) Transcript_11798:16-1056(+)
MHHHQLLLILQLFMTPKRFKKRSTSLSALLLLVYTLVVPSIESIRTNALVIITPPVTSNDFRQLASLLASTFDAAAPTPAAPATTEKKKNFKQDTNNQSIDQFKSSVDWLYWILVEKGLTEQYTYNQYVSTVQKMRGKKYALFVAKEYNSMKQSGDVVGMIEIGMTFYPYNEILSFGGGSTSSTSGNSSCTTTSISSSNGSGTNSTSDEPNQQQQYNTTFLQSQHLMPTIGLVCVKSSHRGRAIGQSLVDKCKYVAKDVWNETCLFADVEPSNTGAMKFLMDSCGFRTVMSENVSTGIEMDDDNYIEDDLKGMRVMMRNIAVSRRRRMECRPHVVLYKTLLDDGLL